jgi:hypothetical protein
MEPREPISAPVPARPPPAPGSADPEADPGIGEPRGSFLLHWAPVWAPLALLAQISILGLGPSLRESRRLSAAEASLSARYGEALESRRGLERMLRALRDPIYIERERRLLRAPHSRLRQP